MASQRRQRVRDPIHGLITFASEGDEARRDQAAWALLNAPEFQRLRRIRQLGLSEFTFPGATHSRFAHSLGVFHTARVLVGILKNLLPDADFDADRASVAVLAALVHDLGHGPFSHAFETVQQARGTHKDHEEWTAEIILNPAGKVRPILERYRAGIAADIAALLTAEDPKDIYHAVVSSSFDADRLDYLRRDRLMTGTGAGAIDFDWLLDNLRVADIPRGGDDDEDSEGIKTFCLDEKALQAAESFLLARYHLFEQVYLHKTTRGFEAIVRTLLGRVAESTVDGSWGRLNLDPYDPLVRFFRADDAIGNYLALDDFAVWSAFARIADCKDQAARDLAQRLRDRRPCKVLDINTAYPATPGEEPEQAEERRQREIVRIEQEFQAKLGRTVFKDAAPIGIYGEIGADQTKTHKMLSIRLRDGSTREITILSPTIRTLSKKRTIVRFYFLDEAERDKARAGGRS
jgi:HD superfamily phosphohydrolase